MSIYTTQKEPLWVERYLRKPGKTTIKTFLSWLMILIAALFYSYEYILRISPGAFFNFYLLNMKISVQNIGHIDASYYWLYTPMQLLVGPLIDHYGVRRLLIIALASCVFGAYCFSTEQYLHLILFGRCLIGFGSAFAFVTVLKIASEWLPKKYFALVSGITMSLGMVGAYTGEVGLAHMVDQLGTQRTMYYMIYFGIALIIICTIFIRNRSKPKKTHARKRSNIFFSSLKQVMTDGQIWLIGIVGGSLFMPTVIFSGLWGVPYFEHIRGFSHLHSAHIASMIFIGWMIGSPIVGMITTRYNCKRFLLSFATISSTVNILLVIYLPYDHLPTLSGLMFLLGFFSSPQILVFSLAFERTKKSLTATAVAVTNMLIMLSGLFQPMIGRIIERGSILKHVGQTTSQQFSRPHFEQAFLIIPIMLLLSFLLLFMIKNTNKGQK